MPVNYQESQITGTKWRRAFRVEIDNPYNKVPKFIFHEECYITMPDENDVRTPAGSLEVTFDQSAEISLINPFTGEPLTDVDNNPQFATHLEAYILLHSLYIQEALARDTATNAQVPDVPELPPE